MKRSAFFAMGLCLSCFAAVPLWFHGKLSQGLSQRHTIGAECERSALAEPLPADSSVQNRAAALRSYGKLPLSFEANRGQGDPQVKFLSHSGPMTLLLTPDEAMIAVAGRAPEPESNRGTKGYSRPRLAHQMEKPQADAVVPASLLRMKLIGANPATEVRGVDELPGKSNYFIGNDPGKWRTNVPNYAKVGYREVYPGVDLSFYGHEQQLEYDFVVSPGADPRAIQLGFAGKDVYIDHEGNLVAGLGKHREVVFHKPVVYQPAKEQSGGKEFLHGAYVLEAGNRVRFHIEGTDPKRALVIDPVLTFATFLGGSGQDYTYGIAVDSSGNSYVTGETTGGFPVTPGSFQPTFPAGTSLQLNTYSAFVTKLNATGTALVYSTYLGGSQVSTITRAIAVDSSGNAYVTGQGGADFPVTPGAFQTSAPQGAAFVTKLNASGSALVYSTFFDGIGAPVYIEVFGIAVDSLGNAYVTGGLTPREQWQQEPVASR
jgi:hypothetical protein